jgi:hypothetical protein
MTGPGDELAAQAGGRGHLRASHADREQVVSMLKAGFVQGMLTKEELDARLSGALVSRTYADLAALTADLPAGLTDSRPPEPMPESANRKAVKAIAYVTAAVWSMLAAAAMAAAAAEGENPLGGLVFAVVFIPFLVIPLAALLLFHEWLEKRAGKRQRSRGLPPGAAGETSQRPAPAGPARQLPQANRHLPHTAETRTNRGPGQPLARWRASHRSRPLRRRYATG